MYYRPCKHWSSKDSFESNKIDIKRINGTAKDYTIDYIQYTDYRVNNIVGKTGQIITRKDSKLDTLCEDIKTSIYRESESVYPGIIQPLMPMTCYNTSHIPTLKEKTNNGTYCFTIDPQLLSSSSVETITNILIYQLDCHIKGLLQR